MSDEARSPEGDAPTPDVPSPQSDLPAEAQDALGNVEHAQHDDGTRCGQYTTVSMLITLPAEVMAALAPALDYALEQLLAVPKQTGELGMFSYVVRHPSADAAQAFLNATHATVAAAQRAASAPEN